METQLPTTLDDLSEAWDRLAVVSGCPTHQFMWVMACAAQFAAPADLRIIVIGTRTDPVAVAPLVTRGTRLPRLELLGAGDLHEPMDVMYRSVADAEALATAIARLGLPVFLQRLMADSPTIAAFTRSWRGVGILMVRPAPASLFLPLDGRWAESEPPLDARRRSDLRRARRRAERIGAVSTHVLSPTPAELPAVLDEFFRVEAAGWKGRAGTALAVDPVRGAFFRSYAARASDAGILRVPVLHIGGRAAAMQLAVECDERLWVLKVGYEESFRHASPGVLMMADVIRWAAARGLRAVEFLGAPEPWVEMWTRSAHECVSIAAYPARPSGMARLAAELIQRSRRKLTYLMGLPW